ncbi:MAG TPA: hypothetical protein VL357_01410 [Rariglobus sp.]|jgi:hypothetical protein|nr:hypothetical protein [Rariglobus sp.]
MRFISPLGFVLVLAALLGAGGCTMPSGKPRPPAQQTTTRTPRGYHPLEVNNGCFVESVHFCDFYGARQFGGPDGWARVLEWSDQKNEKTIRSGYAVAVYTWKEKLWVYDINHGFRSLSAPVGQRLKLAAVTPQIVDKYPDMNPVLMRYLDDVPQSPAKLPPDYKQGVTTMDLDDALHVAVALGKFRPVRVVEFIAPRDSYLRPYAAVVFKYGTRLCIYTSWTGTRVVDAPPLASIDDLDLVQSLVLAVFRNAQQIKWFQPAKTVVIQ